MTFSIKRPDPRRAAFAFELGDLTAQIALAAKKAGISRAEMARRLGVTPAFITRKLSGNTNLTLQTITDLLWAIDHKLPAKKVEPISAVHNRPTTARAGRSPPGEHASQHESDDFNFNTGGPGPVTDAASSRASTTVVIDGLA